MSYILYFSAKSTWKNRLYIQTNIVFPYWEITWYCFLSSPRWVAVSQPIGQIPLHTANLLPHKYLDQNISGFCIFPLHLWYRLRYSCDWALGYGEGTEIGQTIKCISGSSQDTLDWWASIFSHSCQFQCNLYLLVIVVSVTGTPVWRAEGDIYFL